MDAKTTPREAWELYRSKVYSGSIPADQERECSNAFYAGIEAAFKFFDATIDLPVDQVVSRMENWRKMAAVQGRAQNPTGHN